MPTEKPYWANNYCAIFVKTAHSRTYLANQNLGYTIGKISTNGRTRVLSNHLNVENTWVKIRNMEIVLHRGCIGHVEIYQCVVHAHNKQALKTIASKMSNFRVQK